MFLLRRKATIVSLAVCLTILSLACSIGNVHAGTATSITGVETYDSAGNFKTTTYGDTDPFNVGEYVYISWAQIPGTYTVDVSVTNPAGGAVSVYKVPSDLETPTPGVTPENTIWVNQNNAAKLCLVFVASQAGIYHITIKGAGAATMTLDVTVNGPSVLPESPVGSLLATGAGFAAFGIVAAVKLRGSKKPSPLF